MILMFLVSTIYVLATFNFNKIRANNLPDNLNANTLGYNSIVAMPLGLSSSVVFSEAFWQKAWVANDKKTLRRASCVAALLIFICVFTFGLFGFLANWAGTIVSDKNLAFFAIFEQTSTITSTATYVNKIPAGILTIIVILACVMNESAVDSYQLGIVSSVSTCFFKRKPLWVTQLLVFLLNVPFFLLSLHDFGITNLFLSGNIICTSSTLPLLLGFSSKIKPYFGAFDLIISSMSGVVLANVVGAIEKGSV